MDLDVDKVKWFDDGGFSVENCAAHTSSDRVKELAHSAVDGVGVKFDIGN